MSILETTILSPDLKAEEILRNGNLLKCSLYKSFIISTVCLRKHFMTQLLHHCFSWKNPSFKHTHTQVSFSWSWHKNRLSLPSEPNIDLQIANIVKSLTVLARKFWFIAKGTAMPISIAWKNIRRVGSIGLLRKYIPKW